MREIKFRLWIEDQNLMIDGDSLAFEEYEPLCQLLTQDGIMQYTGLKDKNGTEIYSDCDIFKFKYLEQLDKEIELTGSFTFNEDDLRYEIDIYGHDRYIVLNYIGNGIFFDFEIIGTKQENPELLN